jgi:hypothetical protein
VKESAAARSAASQVEVFPVLEAIRAFFKGVAAVANAIAEAAVALKHALVALGA